MTVAALASFPVEEVLDNTLFREILIASLREFDVELIDRSITRVAAHFHDAGQGAGGHLSFITVGLRGDHSISQVIRAGIWIGVVEVTAPERREDFERLLKIEQVQMRERRKAHLRIVPKKAAGVH